MTPYLSCMDIAYVFWRINRERSRVELTNRDIMRLCFLANLFYSNQYNEPIAVNMSFENIYEAPYNKQIDDMLCVMDLEYYRVEPERFSKEKKEIIESVYNIFAHMKPEDYERLKSYILY